MNTIDEIKQETLSIQEDLILCKSELHKYDCDETNIINKITSSINQMKWWDELIANNTQSYNHIIIGLL